MPRVYSLVVKPSQSTPFVPPPDGEIWYLRHAALADGSSLGQYATLYFKTNDDQEISLGTLRPERMDFMTLDFPLTEYIEFSVKGNAEVHLCGYLVAEDEGEIDLEAEDEEEEEMEALEAALMNGGGKKKMTMRTLEEDSDESSEEEPDLLPEIMELTAPQLGEERPKAKAPSGPPGKQASDKAVQKATPRGSDKPTDVAPSAESSKARDEGQLSKKKAKKLKRKQRKEAMLAAAAEETGPQAKQQKTDRPATTPSEEKVKSPEKPKLGEAKKKRIRRFSNGFVIENLSYGPEEGQTVTTGKRIAIKYEGRLKDGTVFDQTRGDKTFTFTYGQGEVVKGLDKGLDDMHVGDKRRLTVPPRMGYGAQGAPPTIPADSQLSFDIEVVKIHDSDEMQED